MKRVWLILAKFSHPYQPEGFRQVQLPLELPFSLGNRHILLMLIQRETSGEEIILDFIPGK